MKSTTHFLLAALLLLCANSLSAQLVLSEIAPTNPNAVADEDGDYPDWLEIYNVGSDAASLEGYSLSDGASPTWVLLAVVPISARPGTLAIPFPCTLNPAAKWAKLTACST